MKKFFIDHNSSTKKAIRQINKLGGHSLIVVQKKNILKGILSSYDLRKAIINKNILNKNINKIYNRKPKYVYSGEIKKNISDIHFKIKRLGILPVIDKETNKIVDILTHRKLKSLKFKKSEKINCNVVIMAGGKGTRLKPYTEILPKPLLPINKKPAIIKKYYPDQADEHSLIRKNLDCLFLNSQRYKAISKMIKGKNI